MENLQAAGRRTLREGRGRWILGIFAVAITGLLFASAAEAGSRKAWKQRSYSYSNGRSNVVSTSRTRSYNSGIPSTYGRYSRVIPMPTYASTHRNRMPR